MFATNKPNLRPYCGNRWTPAPLLPRGEETELSIHTATSNAGSLLRKKAEHRVGLGWSGNRLRLKWSQWILRVQGSQPFDYLPDALPTELCRRCHHSVTTCLTTQSRGILLSALPKQWRRNGGQVMARAPGCRSWGRINTLFQPFKNMF